MCKRNWKFNLSFLFGASLWCLWSEANKHISYTIHIYHCVRVVTLECVTKFTILPSVRIYILFLNAEKIWPIIIYRQNLRLRWVYDKCKDGAFCGGQRNIFDEESEGQPQLWLTESKQKYKKIGMTVHIFLKFVHTTLQMSVVLSIFEMPIFMNFCFKPCFEFVSHNWGPNQGFFLVNVSLISIKYYIPVLLLNWPLCLSHYH